MQFPKIKPSKVVSKEALRPNLTGALVVEEQVYSTLHRENRPHLILYATDSYRFVRLDLGPKEEGNFEGPVPKIALQHMEKGLHFELGEKQITVGITHYDRVMAEGASAEPEQAPWPQRKWADLLPKRGKRRFRFGINPKLLASLAEAMGSAERVEVEFDLGQVQGPKDMQQDGEWSYLKPIMVRPMYESRNDNPQREAMIMPIRIDL